MWSNWKYRLVKQKPKVVYAVYSLVPVVDIYYPVPNTLGDGVLFSIDFFVCMYIYVCIFLSFFLCFFVSKITRKRLDRFAWNFQGRCGVTMGWPDYIFWSILINRAMHNTGTGFVVRSHHSLFCLLKCVAVSQSCWMLAVNLQLRKCLVFSTVTILLNILVVYIFMIYSTRISVYRASCVSSRFFIDSLILYFFMYW